MAKDDPQFIQPIRLLQDVERPNSRLGGRRVKSRQSTAPSARWSLNPGSDTLGRAALAVVGRHAVEPSCQARKEAFRRKFLGNFHRQEERTIIGVRRFPSPKRGQPCATWMVADRSVPTTAVWSRCTWKDLRSASRVCAAEFALEDGAARPMLYDATPNRFDRLTLLRKAETFRQRKPHALWVRGSGAKGR